jgi:flagellar biosynthesis protein FlhB
MSAPSSTSQARTEKPSESRVHEARAHGHAPRAELMGLAAAFLTLSLLLVSFGERITHALQALLREPLRAAAHGEHIPLDQQLATVRAWFGPWLASGLALCFVTIVIARSLAQGGFNFSLRALAPRKRFDKIASTRWLSGLIGVALLCVVIGIALPAALRAEPAEFQPLLTTLALRLVAVLLLLALIDAALSRAAWWRSLWMTRRERKAEDREAYGSPELHAARARIRREMQVEDADPRNVT